ncbi:shikimate dehydrogenase family protein [Feifania hominis]|uniref:shikimate dehydrogenase (NADP(+)) n=1 Tax=Feifania hominis TaxID=2763660 RepID=A0A926DBV4_9FIRM|nr:hypothetical protein [Feifania hominis]MBC8535366.1 hypothetical protein [Feifania hominis]
MTFDNLKINTQTRLMPMIGYPMAQSSASLVYDCLLERFDINRIMWPVEIKKGELASFMQAARTLQIDVFALTMPHKADIIPLLDEVEQSSRLFNSVNIVKTVDGKTVGAGMDGKGCVGALREAGTKLEGANVMLLGTGSISGVVGYELYRSGIGSLTLLNRTLSNAEEVARRLRDNTGLAVEARESTPAELDRAARDADVFIQCSPLGMFGFGADHPYLGFMEKLPAHAVVMEAIVNPPMTTVVKKARQLGLKTIGGVAMTMAQIAEIFEFCFDVHPDAEDLEVCTRVWCNHFGITPDQL